MQTIARKRYLDTLSVLKDKNLIKVATGVRRCGKSTLMTQFQDLLRKENGKVSILTINMDMPEFRFLAEKKWKEIYDYIIKHLKKNVTNYVFIDEVQNVPEFEKLLEGLYVHSNIDLYVTGSNAFLLSSELATLLTGRAYEINVLPFLLLNIWSSQAKPQTLTVLLQNIFVQVVFPKLYDFQQTEIILQMNICKWFSKTFTTTIFLNAILFMQKNHIRKL